MKFAVLFLFISGISIASLATADGYPYTCTVSGYSQVDVNNGGLLEQNITGVAATSELATTRAISACTLIYGPSPSCTLVSCSNQTQPPANPGGFEITGDGFSGNDSASAASDCQAQASRICARGEQKAKRISPFKYWYFTAGSGCVDPLDLSTCSSAEYTSASATFVCSP